MTTLNSTPHMQRKRLHQYAGPALVSLLLAAITIPGCSRFASVFYTHENPEALKRDTIHADGSRTSSIAYPAGKDRGIIDLVDIDLRMPLSKAVVDPNGAEASMGLFEEPRHLMVPSGYGVKVLAWDIGRPRDIVAAPDGSLFVSDFEAGRILHVSSTGAVTPIATGLDYPHGIDLNGTTLFYTDINNVWRYDFDAGDPRSGESKLLTDGIPSGGDFFERTVKYRKADGYLYISIGATDANGEENDRVHATLFRVNAEGGRANRYQVSGLRNTSGMDYHPETGDLWGVDMGIDNLSEGLAPDEINIIKSGGQYGHPYFYSQNFRNPQFKEVNTIQVPKKPTGPIIELEPYSRSIDAEFYEHDALGSEAKNSLIVVMNGYTNGAVVRPEELRTGGSVVQIRAGSDGSNARQVTMISGWLTGEGSYWGRPVGVTWTQDGKTFFVTDEKNGLIYQVSKEPNG